MIKLFTKQFADALPKIFGVKNEFLEPFGGNIQVQQDVKQKDRFIDLKTTDTDVVIQKYDIGENVAFGTGTGNSNRFGPRHEVKSIDTQVEYQGPLAIHDGIDDFTVNDMPEQVVAERLALHGEAWAEKLNTVFAETLLNEAGETVEVTLDEQGVVDAFNQARKLFTNNKVANQLEKYAYVTSDVYNVIMDSKLATTPKYSSTNIDTGEVFKFKGFIIKEIADEYLASTENAQIIFTVANVGVGGLGLQVARTVESEDFAGVALQSAARYATYIPEANKKAIAVAKLTEPVPEG